MAEDEAAKAAASFLDQLAEVSGGSDLPEGHPGLGNPDDWARPVGEAVSYRGQKMVVTKTGLTPVWIIYAFIGGAVLLLAAAAGR
ncbi:MAG: hypothetical protein EPN20_20345 [Magnetospirillum sp.]|nr:MAG: hypothetical protein EPN20_20345 [Magnetospirillum sp.]